MKIDELTIREARQLVEMFRPQIKFGEASAPAELATCEAPWEIGKIYLIRTVTMIDTGRLVAVTPQELVLEDAAWIADTGRFAQAVEKAEFGEVEPFPIGRVIIGRGSIIDAVQITKTPRSQK